MVVVRFRRSKSKTQRRRRRTLEKLQPRSLGGEFRVTGETSGKTGQPEPCKWPVEIALTGEEIGRNCRGLNNGCYSLYHEWYDDVESLAVVILIACRKDGTECLTVRR